MDESLVQRARHGNKAAMAALIQTLSHEDYYTAEAASESFWRVGKRAIAPLIEVLQDRDAPQQARILAAEALNLLGSREGTTAQLALLEDPNEDLTLRQVLARYVGYIGDERSLEPLTRIVLDETADPEMRRGAIYGLRQILDPRAIGPLLALARGEDRNLRERALRALDHLGGARHYLSEGPPQIELPRRFRSPVPKLMPPEGSDYEGGGVSATHFGMTSSAQVRTKLDLSALTRHYEKQLERAHWSRQCSDVGDDISRSEWTFETKWFRRGRARVEIIRLRQWKNHYDIEVQAGWLPNRWFSLNRLVDPLSYDDE